MGIHHSDGGYSASVEAFLRVGDCTLRLAKTNGTTFSLAEPASITAPRKTRAELSIIIDGDKDTRLITLREGLSVGQTTVKYDDAPF